MPVSITRYVVLLSSPSDAKPYCDIARKAIESINRTHSGPAGVELYTTDWRRDSVADSGAEPQALLNKQIVDDADVVLAIFNERFGTPTKNYGSGTEEEIRLGLEDGKRVMVYFRVLPKGLAPSPDAQPDKIAAFRDSLGQSALYKFFSGEADFEATIKHDFESLVSELEHEPAEPKPSLTVATIDCDGALHNGMVEAMPSLVKPKLPESYLDDRIRSTYSSVKVSSVRKPKPLPPKAEEPETGSEKNGDTSVTLAQAYNAFANVKLPQGITNLGSLSLEYSGPIQKLADQMASQALSLYATSTGEPVRIPDADTELVSRQLEQLGIEHDEDLFYLGGLSKSALAPFSSWYPTELNGSDAEKEKYKRLSELVSLCKQRLYLQRFIGAYEKIGGVIFALQNNGKAPARHVRVEIRIPKSLFVDPIDTPLPSDYLIGHFLGEEVTLDSFVEYLFTPEKGTSYRVYEDTCVESESGRRTGVIHRPRFSAGPQGRDPLNKGDFLDTLNYIYGDFSIVEDRAAGETVVSIEFDRVQHGSTYAFPAYLLVRSDLAAPISYRITADEQRDPIVGELAAPENAS